jgi:hypothetical protein
MADFGTILNPNNTTLKTYNKESTTQKLNIVDSNNNNYYSLPTQPPTDPNGDVMVFLPSQPSYFIPLDNLGGGGNPNSLLNFNPSVPLNSGQVIIASGNSAFDCIGTTQIITDEINNNVDIKNNLTVGLNPVAPDAIVELNADLFIVNNSSSSVALSIQSDDTANCEIVAPNNLNISSETGSLSISSLSSSVEIIASTALTNLPPITGSILLSADNDIEIYKGTNKLYSLPTTTPINQNIPLSLQADSSNNLSFVLTPSNPLTNPSYCTARTTLLSIPPNTTPLMPINGFSSTPDFQNNPTSFICGTRGIYFINITGNFQVLQNGNSCAFSFLQNEALTTPAISIGFGGYNTFDVLKPIALSGIIAVNFGDVFTILTSNNGPGDINVYSMILSFFKIA